MDTREKIADYLRLHSREGGCPCEEHQALICEWADQILAIIEKDGYVKLANGEEVVRKLTYDPFASH